MILYHFTKLKLINHQITVLFIRSCQKEMLTQFMFWLCFFTNNIVAIASYKFVNF